MAETYTYNRRWLYGDPTNRYYYLTPSKAETMPDYDLSEIRTYPRLLKITGSTLVRPSNSVRYYDFDPAGTYISLGMNNGRTPTGQILTRVFQLSEGVSDNTSVTFSKGDEFYLFIDADLPTPASEGRTVPQTLYVGRFIVKKINTNSLENRRASFMAEDWSGNFGLSRPYEENGYWRGDSMLTLLDDILPSFRGQNIPITNCGSIQRVVRNETKHTMLEAAAAYFGTNFIVDDTISYNTQGEYVTGGSQLTVCPTGAALEPTNGNGLVFSTTSLDELINWDASINDQTEVWISNPQRRIFDKFYTPFIPEDPTAEAMNKLWLRYHNPTDPDDVETHDSITLTPATGTNNEDEISSPFTISDLEAQIAYYTSQRHLQVQTRFHTNNRGKHVSVDIPCDPLVMPCGWYGFYEEIPTLDGNGRLIKQRIHCLGMVTSTEFHFCGKTRIECRSIT